MPDLYAFFSTIFKISFTDPWLLPHFLFSICVWNFYVQTALQSHALSCGLSRLLPKLIKSYLHLLLIYNHTDSLLEPFFTWSSRVCLHHQQKKHNPVPQPNFVFFPASIANLLAADEEHKTIIARKLKAQYLWRAILNEQTSMTSLIQVMCIL